MVGHLQSTVSAILNQHEEDTLFRTKTDTIGRAYGHGIFKDTDSIEVPYYLFLIPNVYDDCSANWIANLWIR